MSEPVVTFADKVAALFGLPPGTNPDKLLDEIVSVQGTNKGLAELVEIVTARRDAVTEALGELGDAVEKARTDLAEVAETVATAPAHGVRATLLRIRADLGIAFETAEALDVTGDAEAPGDD